MSRQHGKYARTIRIPVAVLGTMMVLVAPAGVSFADDPPGNNGTVKVDGVDFDAGLGNEPHQGCSFNIEFFGYDEGAGLFADFTLEGHPPTGGGVLATGTVCIGGDAAGGANDLDAVALVDLAGVIVGDAHVKLTVHADGSQGADTKHKTFWVFCEDTGGGGGDT